MVLLLERLTAPRLVHQDRRPEFSHIEEAFLRVANGKLPDPFVAGSARRDAQTSSMSYDVIADGFLSLSRDRVTGTIRMIHRVNTESDWSVHPLTRATIDRLDSLVTLCGFPRAEAWKLDGGDIFASSYSRPVHLSVGYPTADRVQATFSLPSHQLTSLIFPAIGDGPEPPVHVDFARVSQAAISRCSSFDASDGWRIEFAELAYQSPTAGATEFQNNDTKGPVMFSAVVGARHRRTAWLAVTGAAFGSNGREYYFILDPRTCDFYFLAPIDINTANPGKRITTTSFTGCARVGRRAVLVRSWTSSEGVAPSRAVPLALDFDAARLSGRFDSTTGTLYATLDGKPRALVPDDAARRTLIAIAELQAKQK